MTTAKVILISMLVMLGMSILEIGSIHIYKNVTKSNIANEHSSNQYRITFSDISDPLTIEQIKNEITAESSNGDDLTNYLYIISDDYSGNELIVGNYKIVLGVTDSKGLTAIFHLEVRVVDMLEENNTGGN